MPITEEGGGRLNSFAQEPEIEVIETGSSSGSGFRLLLIFGILLITALITFRVTTS